MTIDKLIQDCPALDEATIRKAYDHIVRTVKLQPLLLTVRCDKIPPTDLTQLDLIIHRGDPTFDGRWYLVNENGRFLLDENDNFLMDWSTIEFDFKLLCNEDGKFLMTTINNLEYYLQY